MAKGLSAARSSQCPMIWALFNSSLQYTHLNFMTEYTGVWFHHYSKVQNNFRVYDWSWSLTIAVMSDKQKLIEIYGCTWRSLSKHTATITGPAKSPAAHPAEFNQSETHGGKILSEAIKWNLSYPNKTGCSHEFFTWVPNPNTTGSLSLLCSSEPHFDLSLSISNFLKLKQTKVGMNCEHYLIFPAHIRFLPANHIKD